MKFFLYGFIGMILFMLVYCAQGNENSETEKFSQNLLGYANAFAISADYGRLVSKVKSPQICHYGFLLDKKLNLLISSRIESNNLFLKNAPIEKFSKTDFLNLRILIKMEGIVKSTSSDSVQHETFSSSIYRPIGDIIFYPNLYSVRVENEKKYFIDKNSIFKNILFETDLSGLGVLFLPLYESNMLSLFAWEPYGRYWELKAKDFEALKKMNELKISAFEKLLKKTENDPQFAKLYLENRPDSYNPERRIIKRKPEALEKAWQKFSARWEKENPKLVPKFKIIPLLPESDSQMKK